jgi:hypothetical protein
VVIYGNYGKIRSFWWWFGRQRVGIGFLRIYFLFFILFIIIIIIIFFFLLPAYILLYIFLKFFFFFFFFFFFRSRVGDFFTSL